MLLVFRGLTNDGTSASMYREIMLRNKSIFQISTLICLSSISILSLALIEEEVGWAQGLPERGAVANNYTDHTQPIFVW
jgi:hypothetical protein